MFRRDLQLPKEIPPVPPPRDRSEMAPDPETDLATNPATNPATDLAPTPEMPPAPSVSDGADTPSASRWDALAPESVPPEPVISGPLTAAGQPVEVAGRTEPLSAESDPESENSTARAGAAGVANPAAAGVAGDRPIAPSPNAPPSPGATDSPIFSSDAPIFPSDDRRPLTALPTTPGPKPAGAKPQDSWAHRSSPVPPLEAVWASDDIPYQPKELGVVDQLMVLLADGVAQWRRLLRWVRSQLPPNLQLSDEVLTAIALGVLILLLALGNPGGGKRGAKPIATDPLPRLVAAQPDPGDAAPTALPAPGVEPTAPPPAPNPEQGPIADIADIQERVSAISRSYAVGLIQSVEVNLPANTLGVNLAEAWYGLLPSQQDDIAQDIYHQAQGLTFGTLELRDSDGVVVARSPVVGDTMVVLHRLRAGVSY